jgi:2,4-dienoyl-CoA reductase-like NADH-dependent reductase (Old Yellow Enzyme family)
LSTVRVAESAISTANQASDSDRNAGAVAARRWQLLEPLRIGSLELPNRIALAPMTTRLADEQGFVTDDLIAYYEARARAGVGLITLELSSPHPSGAHRRRELGIHDDAHLDGLSRLVERVHAHNARISVQIGHAGAHARPDVTGWPAISPSGVSHVVKEGSAAIVRPRTLLKDEIPRVVAWYGEAARRLARAGFDMLEVQGGHDYLVFQFLSPLDNRRTDAYGGDLPGRARFALEVVSAMRDAAPGLPLAFRYSADEFAPGGFSATDGLELAHLLVREGVDLLSISGGSARSKPIPWLITTPMAYPPGLFVPLAATIKSAVEVPVAVAGRLHDPELAETVLRRGHADLIVLGRALLADPEWVAKLRAGDLSSIRPCIACNTCVDHLRAGRSVSCLVNPHAGRELQLPSATPSTSVVGKQPAGRKVVVIGGGPAGLTAAAEFAARGDHVVLFEGKRLGGRLNDVSRAPYFQVVETAQEPFQRLIDYLQGQADRAGVDVRVGLAATQDAIIAERPDIVIVAIGARYPVPGMLELLRIPLVRWLARLPQLRKRFFSLLRPRPDPFTDPLAAAGVDVRIIGDHSGTRGVEAAILSGIRCAAADTPVRPQAAPPSQKSMLRPD